MSKITALVLALVVVAGVAGCGGGAGTSSPNSTAKAYLTSIANGDGKAACATLTPSLQHRALTTARAQGISASNCASLFAQVKAHMTPDTRQKFLNAKISNVTTVGNTATVTLAGAASQPTLTKVGGRWLISGGVGF